MTSPAGRLGALLHRLIGLADEPTDDEDARLRKRVGVIAGYVNIVGPFSLPIMSQGHPVGWFVFATMPLINAVNLYVLARTRVFERYVIVLILSVMLLPAGVEIGLGGLGGSSAGFVFAFLGPVYAILALGPRRATRFFILFILLLIAVILADPLISRTIEPQPYEMRLVFYAANLGLPLGITFAMLRYTDLRRRQAQARVDELLTNAIPAAIAARLKAGEQHIAEAYPQTTVLFADLAGFTPWTQRTDPDRVVSFLDELFSRFDALAAELGVEKIKTIGDAYMAVAGAPQARDDHATAALALARGMLAELEGLRRRDRVPLELRIGLASGLVVGGVIGQRRILFDLWGATVNLASRMQSSGIAGRIQVAPSTYELLAELHPFEERGPLEVKGLGSVKAYLLVSD